MVTRSVSTRRGRSPQGQIPEVGRVKFPDGSLVKCERQRISKDGEVCWIMLLEDHGNRKTGDMLKIGIREFVQDEE